MSVLGEPGWGLLLAAGLALEDARRDPLRAAALLAKRRKGDDASRRAAALELVTEGVKLAEKVGAFDRLLAVRGAVEQATSGRVATWHAQRIPDGARVVEIGCGCGGDTLALAHRARNLIATDTDPVRAACTHMNLAALGLSNARAVPGDGFDVLATEGGDADVVFVDPDRRPGGERTLDPEAWAPPISMLVDLARGREVAAARDDASTGTSSRPPSDAGARHPDGRRRVLVKAAPSLDADRVADAFDVAYVSHGGECVEAFLESRDDLAAPQRVRAVLLPDDGPSIELEGDRGDAPVGPVGDAILVPDPAAIRAHLLREMCLRHGLTLVGDGIAWLTGPADVACPFLGVYSVVESCEISAVPAALRRLGARRLRVHTRGVPAAAGDLEAEWRRALDDDGDGGTLDVFVSRFLGRPSAVVARD